MGVIYRGVDSVLDREVAIKVMSSDFSEITDDQRARFFREAKAAARLQHRNIVTVFEFAEQDGVPYIVMEFLKGRSLSARMSVEPPLTLEQKLDVITELCNGLDFAHENGVVHRDVKPANVWLLEDGAVKLVDFGIAKISSSMMTMHGDVMGSASYMSPEHIEGASVTGRSDVFSAAVMLYELIARRRPFEGDSPTATMMQIVHQPPPPIESIVTDLPKELVAAIARGLEKNPDDRYQTAAEFGAELQLIRMALPRDEATVLQAAGPDVTQDSLPLRSEPLPRQVGAKGSNTTPVGWPKINPWIVAVAVALVLALAIGYWVTRSPASGPVAGTGSTPGPVAGPPAPNPAPPPQPPTTRKVAIDSKPQGAAIFLNDVDTGLTTPADIDVEAAGAAIRLEKPSYESRKATIADAELQAGRASYDLRPIQAALVQVTVTGGYPFEVYDGKTKLSDSKTEHKISARDGQILILRSDEYYLNHPYIVRGSKVASIMAPGTGRVVFTQIDSCRVSIDGRSVDYGGVWLGPMAAVEHTFTFSCRGGNNPAPIRTKVAVGDNDPIPVKR